MRGEGCSREAAPDTKEAEKGGRAGSEVVLPKLCSLSIRIIRPTRRRRNDERETDKEVEDCVCDKGVEEPRILHQEGEITMTKWTKWHPNYRLLTNLLVEIGLREFGCKDAYAIYWRLHARKRKEVSIGPFQKMNVRNTLCAAVEQRTVVRGAYGLYVLDRVRKGVYRWRRG